MNPAAKIFAHVICNRNKTDLCKILKNLHYDQAKLCSKLISYADDITYLMKIRCFDSLLCLTENFCRQTQMMIDRSTSEVLSLPNLSPYKTVNETKILGSSFYTSAKVESIELMLSYQVQKHRRLISLTKSLRAKSLTLSVNFRPSFFKWLLILKLIWKPLVNAKVYEM